MTQAVHRTCNILLACRARNVIFPSRLTFLCANQIRTITSRQRDPHKRNFPKEEKPDYDLEGGGFINEGEVIIPPPKRKFTNVEEVKDPELWKYVERLIPRMTVPEIPEHKSYPTPSGWVPPREESLELTYQVPRTKFHHFPLYLEVMDGGVRKMTCIDKVDGDIWLFENEIRTHLEEKFNQPIFTQVDEVCTKLRVRGNFMEEVNDFLLEKGF